MTIPLTIVGGYLGAGKTTLINALLAGEHGLRLAVIVNDFGSINIDADLILNTDGETISLANGCICCRIADDLATSLISLSEKTSLIDHVLIEASGVAEPARIASYATALPAFDLESILVLVDAETFQKRSKDKFVGSLVLRQIGAADILLLTKTDLLAPDRAHEIEEAVSAHTNGSLIRVSHGDGRTDLLLGHVRSSGRCEASQKAAVHGHGFATWAFETDSALDRATLLARLTARPASIHRIKGILALTDDPDHRQIVQSVGRRMSITQGAPWGEAARNSQLVAIGIKDDGEAEAWAGMCCAELFID